MTNRIKNQPRGSSKIPPEALAVPPQTRPEYPVFSFMHVSKNHCVLSEWKSDELKELIESFKTMEQLTWIKVSSHGGLRFKPIDKYTKPLPPEVSPDVTVCEFRVCDVKRVFGYRVGNVFRILWFDRSHEVCPWNRVKRA